MGRIFDQGQLLGGSHMLGFFGEFLYCRRKVKCSSFNLKNGSIHKNRKFRLGIAKITYLPKSD